MDENILKPAYEMGIKLCYENAKRLYIEAIKAIKNGLWTSSYLMGFYSWEEIGKAFFILDHHDEEFITRRKWNDVARGSGSHSIKIDKAERGIDLSLMVSQGLDPEYVDKFRKGEYELVPDEKFLKKMHKLRTSGLYVDYNFTENKWDVPTIITDELAFTVFRQASLAIRAFEIELNRKGIEIE